MPVTASALGFSVFFPSSTAPVPPIDFLFPAEIPEGYTEQKDHPSPTLLSRLS